MTSYWKIHTEDGVVDREAVPGMTFEDLEKELPAPKRGVVTLARFNNTIRELDTPIPEGDLDITLLDTSNADGKRAYMRSLSFAFIIAARKLFPEYEVFVEHSISGGLYCTLRKDDLPIQPDSHMKNELRRAMRELIERNLPITRTEMDLEEAKALFRVNGESRKSRLLEYRREKTIGVYSLDGNKDHFFGYLVPNTERLKVFDLELFRNGIVILGVQPGTRDVVRNFYPQYKLSEIYNENEEWSKLQGIDTVASLNKVVESGRIGEVIRISEDLQFAKIFDICNRIYNEGKRIILIAAPSCSGKTSFAYKLRTGLSMLGLRPQAISMDDYYVNREQTPRDENGDYDFESVHAIDLDQFNKDLNDLLDGKEIERIRFEFVNGQRIHTGEMFSLGRKDPVIIEGIHGLNPILTDRIPPEVRLRIYISVITQINLDEHNRIPTTDLRLLRRLARDAYSRGRDVHKTMAEWPAVRRGEERNIFPYQEQADVLFNSSFLFEIAMLRPLVEPMLASVTPEEPAFVEAARLKSMLQYFVPIEDKSDVVNTSILREFIGGSKLV